ncbi:hypothetical protein B0A52_06571 [Exophiala mesophila]|uniref:AB hydrolase-1 domain-containing protein n=1 Tax=Exophiala mesophila TaxID=212818 RepID=A0A438N1D7_EXOME|nr:hypothetical protein B0A52_06571 [Exophiala mesophila]
MRAPLKLASRSYTQISQRCFSTTPAVGEVVDLAFQRHDPPSQPDKSRPPIILMHGLFGSQRNNRTMSKVLAKDLLRPVYNLDLRNHGDSPHIGRHDYTAMAQDVEHFLGQHDLRSQKPILIGHSMGAKTAMTMALRSPDAYSALIPVDNAPVDAALRSDFGKYVRAMKEIEDQRDPKIEKQSDADKILQKYEKDPAIRAFLLTNLVKMPKRAADDTQDDKNTKDSRPQLEYRFRIPLQTLAKALPSLGDFPFKDPEKARYEGPTLVVRGTKSHYVSDEALPLIGRFFPRFELLDCDCGHWVMSEKFEEFRSGVVEWIGRVVDQD